MESNDLMRTGRTKRGGPEQEGDVRDEEGVGASSQTGRATFISGPTACYPNIGFGDEVKGREYDRAH